MAPANDKRRLVARACEATVRRPKRIALLLVMLHLVLGTLYSLAVPPWEAHDEWSHYKYVEYVARHKALPPPDRRLTDEFEFDQATQPPLYYIIAALPVSLVDTADGIRPDINPYLVAETGAGGINAAVHHPAEERFPWRGTMLALRLARGISLLISLIGLVAVYRLGRLLAPERPWVALLALAFAALSPQYLFISAVVTNDVLIAALGCVIAWLGVKVILEGLRPTSALALALACGLALVTKLSAPALLPFVALALIAGAVRTLRRGGSRLAVLGMLGGVGVAGVGLVALWLWRNWRLTGNLIPRDRWIAFRLITRWIERDEPMPPMRLDMLPPALRYAFKTFWASFGWGNLEAPQAVYIFFAVLCAAGLAGLIWWLVNRHCGRGRKLAAALLGLLAGSVLFLAAYRDFDYGSQLIRGRYLLPALGAVAILLALGIDQLIAGTLRPWDRGEYVGQCGVMWGLIGILTAVNLALPWTIIAPAYAPPSVIAGTRLGEAVALLPGEQPLGARFAPAGTEPAAELVAYETWPDEVRSGEALGVTLVWRVLRPLPANYTVAVHVLDPAANPVGGVNVYPGYGNYASTLWRSGDVFRDTYWVPLRAEISQPSGGHVKVALFLDDAAQEHLSVTDALGVSLGDAVMLGRFKLAPAMPAGELPSDPGLATLDHSIRLSAATWESLAGPLVLAGQPLTVTLTWDVLARPSADYQVFVHLDGPNETAAFGDGPPVNGSYPTDMWARGEHIVDPHVVQLPADLPAGAYRLVAGMYASSGARAAAVASNGMVLQADAVVLGEITVARRARRGFLPLLLGPARAGQ